MHKIPSTRSASTNPQFSIVAKLNVIQPVQVDANEIKNNNTNNKFPILQKELIVSLLKMVKKKPNQLERKEKKNRTYANSGSKQLCEISRNVIHIRDYEAEQAQYRKLLNKITIQEKCSLEDYQIIQFLGKGKYSEVKLARDKRSGLYVALKIMKKQLIQSCWKSIAQELKIQYLLNHPNVVKLYTFFQTTNEIILVLEYCCDGQLLKLLRNLPNFGLTEEIASSYIRQIASALNYLHKNEVIHRDIKPENIFVSFQQVKLADFTHSIYSPQQERSTQCGSLAYISPEIIKGESYDKSTDMWSLGVLTYELCSGETPWEDLTFEEMQVVITQGNIKFPNHFSDELKDFINNLIQIDSKNRMNARQVLSHPWILDNVSTLQLQFDI